MAVDHDVRDEIGDRDRREDGGEFDSVVPPTVAGGGEGLVGMRALHAVMLPKLCFVITNRS
jgi:hypothetical protein